MNKINKILFFAIFLVAFLHQTRAAGKFLTQLNPWFKVACIAENIKVCWAMMYLTKLLRYICRDQGGGSRCAGRAGGVQFRCKFCFLLFAHPDLIWASPMVEAHPCTVADLVRERSLDWFFHHNSNLLKLSFMVLFICKKHVIKLGINIWPS